MAIQKRKSVKDIKTHAGIVNKRFLPHEAYMRITTLEMERVHRIREMESARQRIKTVSDRIKEIDIEKNILLDRIKVTTESIPVNTKANIKTDDIARDNRGQLLRY